MNYIPLSSKLLFIENLTRPFCKINFRIKPTRKTALAEHILIWKSHSPKRKKDRKNINFNTTAHSSRQQTSASFAQFLLKRQHNSPLSCSSLVIVGKSDESIIECSRVSQLKDENVWLLLHGNAIKVHMCPAYQFITVIIVSWQGKERNWALQMFDALNYVPGPYLYCCWSVVLFWALFVGFFGGFLGGGIDCSELLWCGLFGGC